MMLRMQSSLAKGVFSHVAYVRSHHIILEFGQETMYLNVHTLPEITVLRQNICQKVSGRTHKSDTNRISIYVAPPYIPHL